MTARDVIFDEGSGHQMYVMDDEMDDLLSAHETHDMPSAQRPGILTPQQPIAPQVNGGVPLHEAQAPATDPADMTANIPDISPGSN